MKTFYVTFRKISVISNSFLKIEAENIDQATKQANSIFKNVDMVLYAEPTDLKLFEL